MRDVGLKSSNPAFGGKTFEATAVRSGYGPTMTISGTINKAGLLMLCVFATAAWSWDQFLRAGDPSAVSGYIGIGAIGGFVLAMVTIFKKEWSPITAPLYSLFEGLALGSLSAIMELRFPGIAIQSVALTFGTLFCMLAAYRSGLIRNSQKLTIGIVSATGAIALIYFASFLLGIFHVQIPGIFGSGPVGILFSLVVTGVAAVSLILDFDMIERGAEAGAPKYMEWYSAFGLMLTLVWLYMEILRLLGKLRDRR